MSEYCGHRGANGPNVTHDDLGGTLPWGMFATVCEEKATRMFVSPEAPKVHYRCDKHADEDRAVFEKAEWLEVKLVEEGHEKLSVEQAHLVAKGFADVRAGRVVPLDLALLAPEGDDEEE